MRATTLLLFLSSIAPASLCFAESGAGLPEFLEGCWRSDGTTSTTVETWLAPSDNLMLGISEVRRDGLSVAWEYLRIELDGERTVLVAWPSGQQAAEFELVSTDAAEWVFENLQHDFPQRIIYPEPDDSGLHARISGIADASERTISFDMHAVDCSNPWTDTADVAAPSQSG